MPILSAGYYTARILDTPEALSQGLLPPRILTLSPCLTEFLPDAWAIEWAQYSDADRVTAAAKLGIPADAVPALVRRITDAFEASEVGWSNVWLSLDAARVAARDFLPDSSNFALLGLGVPADLVDTILSALEPKPGEGLNGLHTAVSRRAPLEPGGEPIGWEILGAEVGGAHSWLCNSVHVLAQSRLGVTPNALGLIDTEQQARAVMNLISGDSSLAEPVPWFPGLLVRYQL